MAKDILCTRGLTKRFGKENVVVNGISIHIPKGKIYGLLGPNGAGKSTLLKMIVGALYPTEGEIEFENKPWKREMLNDIGALIETPAIYGNLTAIENLKVHTTLLGINKERIGEVLQIVDLQNTGRKKACHFSLGMKQRLGIAIALLASPRLLILDEPTNGLDPIGIQALRNLIQSFANDGITVIVSSHMLSEVEQIADYVGIMNAGKLIFEGKLQAGTNLEELFTKEVINGGGRVNA